MPPVTVLMIDDDHHLSRVIELGLAHLSDLVFRHASNGRQGAQMAEADPPDLILLDFEMPEMDGLDTLRRLRASERTARTPIVAITGLPREMPRCAEMIAGCDSHLPKPFQLSTLYRTMRTFLNDNIPEAI